MTAPAGVVKRVEQQVVQQLPQSVVVHHSAFAPPQPPQPCAFAYPVYAPPPPPQTNYYAVPPPFPSFVAPQPTAAVIPQAPVQPEQKAAVPKDQGVPDDNPGLPLQDEVCPFHQRLSYWADMLRKSQV